MKAILLWVLPLSLLSLPIHATPVPSGPLVRIPAFKQPPALDGKGDDPCWEQALEVSDFQLMGTHQPLETGRTRFRAGYDANHLYLYAWCEEPILSVASQRRHEIIAKTTTHDGEVINDDSLWIMLVPPGSKMAYEIAVNTLGTLADGQTTLPNAWEQRDLSWQSGAKAAVRVEDGFWSLEMAIPWNAIPETKPKAGESWQIAIARLARARLEQSSWNRSLRGAHEPEAFGAFVLGTNPPSLRRDFSAPVLEAGQNTIKLETGRPATPEPRHSDFNLVTEISTMEGQIISHHRQSVDLSITGKLEHHFEIPELPTVQQRWMLVDRATLEPEYRSPVTRIPVESSAVKLSVATEGAFRVIVNDQLIGEGNQQAEHRISLRNGLNVIAVEAASGEATLQLDSPALGTAPIRWKMAEATLPSATDMETDDLSWPLAPPVPGSSAIGAKGNAKVFRHTILQRQTKVWPVPSPVFHVMKGTPQHLNLLANGIPNRPFHDWVWEVEVSPGLELLGSSGFNGNRNEKELQDPTKPLYQMSKGERQGHYRVTANKPIIHRAPSVPILWLVELLLGTTDQEENQPQFLRLSARANGGSLSELQQHVSVNLLPESKGRRPKEIRWQFWSGWLDIMDDHAMQRQTLQNIANAGMTEMITGKNRELSGAAREVGLRAISIISFVHWSINLNPVLRDQPDKQLSAFDGTRKDDLMCTTLLLGEEWPVVEAALQATIQQEAGNDLIYDFEYRTINGPHSCYCPRCLDEFASSAGLDSPKGLTPELIEQKHSSAWTDFMTRRTAKILAKMKATLHAVDPSLRFGLYSGYQTEENPSRYGIDWRYVGEAKAVDMAGGGYGRPLKAMEATLEAMPNIPFLFGELINPYLKPVTELTRPLVPLTVANLLRRSLDSPWGVLIYDRNPMDGRCWQAIADTTRLVAEHEQLFIARRLRDLPGYDPAQIQLLEGENETLLFVLNLQQTPTPYTLKLPEELGEGKEYYSNQTVSQGKQLQLTLSGGEAKVYHFRKKATAATPGRPGEHTPSADETSGKKSLATKSRD